MRRIDELKHQMTFRKVDGEVGELIILPRPTKVFLMPSMLTPPGGTVRRFGKIKVWGVAKVTPKTRYEPTELTHRRHYLLDGYTPYGTPDSRLQNGLRGMLKAIIFSESHRIIKRLIGSGLLLLCQTSLGICTPYISLSATARIHAWM